MKCTNKDKLKVHLSWYGANYVLIRSFLYFQPINWGYKIRFLFRIVHELTSALEPKSIQDLIQLFKGIVTQSTPNDTNRWSNSDRSYAGFQIVKLHNTLQDLSLRLEVLKQLFNLAFIKNEETQNIGVDLAG